MKVSDFRLIWAISGVGFEMKLYFFNTNFSLATHWEISCFDRAAAMKEGKRVGVQAETGTPREERNWALARSLSSKRARRTGSWTPEGMRSVARLLVRP